jgi:Na+-driven multidrug efflux pump
VGTRATIANSLGGGGVVGQHASASVAAAVREAFVSALSTGLLIGAIVTVCGAVLAWVLIESKATAPQAAEQPRTAVGTEPEPNPAPQPELVA